MSNNVIQFPKPSDSGLTTQLKNLQFQLSENYQQVMENYMLSRSLELESQTLQKQYDEILMQYAGIVGHENIPVGYMEYSTHVVEKREDEGIEMKPAEEDEELKELQKRVHETMDELATYLQGKMEDELQ